MQNLLKFLLFVFALLFCQINFSQSFKIGTIDVYGNRKTSAGIVLDKLSLKEGDSINPAYFNPEKITAILQRIPGVRHATVNPVCCDTANNLMLFIGIGETDSTILDYRIAPSKKIILPGKMMAAYKNLEDQLEPAIKSGQASEDDSKGYALFDYAPARNEQIKFIGFAQQDFSLLVNVLKNSVSANDRAAAAGIIAYSADKKKVTGYLLPAINDPDEEVRNNATRALGILAGYITSHPNLKIIIPPGPFINMINSIVWTDRNKGANVLVQLSKSRNPKLLNEIKKQALPSLIEMAKWKDRGHALFSFVLLGRIAGIDEPTLITKNYSNDWPAELEIIIDKCGR